MDLDDFTNSRLIFLQKELMKYNEFISTKCTAEKDVELEKLRSELRYEIERYQELYTTYLSKPDDCVNRNYVNAHLSELDKNLSVYFKMIPNYRFKLENNKYQEFTPDMLHFATEEYKRLNNNIQKKCEK